MGTLHLQIQNDQGLIWVNNTKVSLDMLHEQGHLHAQSKRHLETDHQDHPESGTSNKFRLV